MTWFKFLARGATGPFSGYHWPRPTDAAPGAWTVAEEPLEPCRRGFHLCRARDLPYWLNEELYAVEVSGPVLEQESFVLATQARLLHRITGWSPDAARRFSAACAWKVRDLVTAALHVDGRDAEAHGLTSAESLTALLEPARSVGGDGRGSWLAGYLVDAATFADRVGPGDDWAVNTATTALVTTTAARAAAEPGKERAALERELGRQTAWLVSEVVTTSTR